MKKKKKDKRIHMSTLWVVTAAFLIGIVALTFSYVNAWSERMKTLEEKSSSKVFEQFETQTIFGETYSNDDAAKSKVTAYNVWETTCPACLGEMGALEDLSKKFPQEEFQLVGVCADLFDKNGNLKQSQLEKAQSLMNDAGTTFPHIIPTRDMSVFFESVVPGFPTTFFVDRNGKIIGSVSGSNDLNGWTERVKKVLSSIE
ncbi:MAG: TlpA family protein disulfide reductase [Mogibacterium sp.]|nr:TlpA family protein disulfide reductase [Mogibacterium sp.]